MDKMKANIEEPNNNNNTHKNRKVFKLKKSIKVSLPEEELKN